jgi:hypothetical protein
MVEIPGTPEPFAYYIKNTCLVLFISTACYSLPWRLGKTQVHQEPAYYIKNKCSGTLLSPLRGWACLAVETQVHHSHMLLRALFCTISTAGLGLFMVET